MLGLLVCEAALSATTTALIIQAGRDLAKASFVVSDFIWIALAQSAAYGVGAVSWVFAERAGFGAFGRYMLQFTRDNRRQTALLGDKARREAVEPFLTNETFHIFFELIYELEADLKLLFGLIFNAAVLALPWMQVCPPSTPLFLRCSCCCNGPCASRWPGRICGSKAPPTA